MVDPRTSCDNGYANSSWTCLNNTVIIQGVSLVSVLVTVSGGIQITNGAVTGFLQNLTVQDDVHVNNQSHLSITGGSITVQGTSTCP